MELVILGILNAVLLVLLVVAFKLIRKGSKREPVAAAAPEVAANQTRAEEEVIDLREDAAQQPDLPRTLPVYTDPVFGADGTPLPENVFESPDRADVPPHSLAASPAPFPPPIGSAPSLNSLNRSAIVIDSSLNGSGPTPSELLFSVIETLGTIGFELTKDSPNYGLLKDTDDHTASVDLSKRPNGTDRIAIAVDSQRAVEALAMLEIWHRSRLGATDQVRLSARIR